MALYVVATPLGTLADLSPRAREVLGASAFIACEDTRVTRRLLSAVGVSAPPLVALHAHNEAEVADSLAQRALAEDGALVSDAGTPGVSDPGTRLVERALSLGVRVLSVPGPSALAAAVAASGFPAAPLSFLGFAPRRGRDGFVADLAARPETVVVFEAPGRIADLVGRLAGCAPTREAALCREISKRFEEVVRRPLPDLAADLQARSEILGECVLVVGPGEGTRPVAAAPPEPEGLKDIAAYLAERWGAPRRDIYQRLLAWERESGGT